MAHTRSMHAVKITAGWSRAPSLLVGRSEYNRLLFSEDIHPFLLHFHSESPAPADVRSLCYKRCRKDAFIIMNRCVPFTRLNLVSVSSLYRYVTHVEEWKINRLMFRCSSPSCSRLVFFTCLNFSAPFSHRGPLYIPSSTFWRSSFLYLPSRTPVPSFSSRLSRHFPFLHLIPLPISTLNDRQSPIVEQQLYLCKSPRIEQLSVRSSPYTLEARLLMELIQLPRDPSTHITPISQIIITEVCRHSNLHDPIFKSGSAGTPPPQDQAVKWLRSSVSYRTIHDEVYSARTTNTGEPFFKNPQYIAWVHGEEEHHKCLECTGKRKGLDNQPKHPLAHVSL